MTPESLNARLDNYRDLVFRVDEMCRRIEETLGPEVTCTRGCDGCCRHFSLFPVEAVALAAALQNLPSPEVDRIRVRARASLPDGSCPLLEEHCCLLYPARPLICRTHGLPLLVNRDGERRVEYCPLNFRGVSSLPGSAVIDLDRLNETLVAVNLLFATPSGLTSSLPERFTIAEALLLETSLP